MTTDISSDTVDFVRRNTRRERIDQTILVNFIKGWVHEDQPCTLI